MPTPEHDDVPLLAKPRLSRRVCICCGEPVVEERGLSRNRNLCDACDNFVDSTEEFSPPTGG